MLDILDKVCYIINTITERATMKTLCNKAKLKDGNCTFTQFNFYKKQRDDEGDICYYTARLNYKNEYFNTCSVAVQNGKVVGWET